MKIKYLVIVLALVFAVEGFLIVPEVWGPGRQFLAAVLPALVVDYANNDRLATEVQPLKDDPLLTKAAQLKAEDMAKRSYFAHEGPDGESPWYWIDQVGYKYVYAGENLAINFFDSSDVNNAWMNSPKHRDNILDKRFTDIGVGMANGQFEGRTTVFIVQFFGSTEESLAAQSTGKISVLGGRGRLLSAVAGVTDSLTSLGRSWSLKVLNLFGYTTTTGRVI